MKNIGITKKGFQYHALHSHLYRISIPSGLIYLGGIVICVVCCKAQNSTSLNNACDDLI